jgi:hypothetical protein
MASIKISALGELELDRLSDADVFIINDQDATTQKITFKTVKEGLERDNRAYKGKVEFHNEVKFLGPLAGRDVYTKTETDAAIATALVPVQTDVTALEDQQAKILDNLGTTASTYITDELSGSLLSAGPKNVKGALSALGLGFDAQGVRLTSAEGGITDNTAAIAVEEDRNDAQDTKIAALETAVGLPGGNSIADNGTLISDNTGNIGALANVIGVAVGESTISVGTITGGIIEGSAVPYTVIGALGALETNLVAANTSIGTLATDLTLNGVKTQENRNGVNTLRAALLAALASYSPSANTASELVDHLESELGANTAALT